MRITELLSRSAQAAAQRLLLLVLMVAPSAPEVVHVQCDVSDLPGGLVRYQLRTKPGLDSAPLPQDCTQRSWENAARTVLALDSDVNPALVQSVTNWALELKQCLEFTHFTADCSASGFVEAICRFNCSSVTEPSRADPPGLDPSTSDSQSSCGSLCVALIAVAVVVPVVFAAGLMFWKLLLPRLRDRCDHPRARDANPEDRENQANAMLA